MAGQGDQGTRLAVSFSPNWSGEVETAAQIDRHLGPIAAGSFEDRLLLCPLPADQNPMGRRMPRGSRPGRLTHA
jgi:hypothetical protein